MMTEIGSLPQNDIPDVVNAIVQYAVLGLNSTEYFHDFAGDPLCFLLRDSKTRLRHTSARDILENASLNDLGGWGDAG